jgi:hypothetical protein
MVASAGVRELRARAIAHTFFRPASLRRAIDRLGFVQADPIRSPARAQDLILRQRVAAYRAGDLERRYASLDIEEDYLHVYGFLPRRNWELVHPRKARTLTELETNVLAHLRDSGPLHPSRLRERFGDGRVVNDWGGFSKATKRALERLHDLGLVRIARRDNGVRVYEAAQRPSDALTPEERLRRLARIFANLLAPVSEKTLQSIVTKFRGSLALRDLRGVLRAMVTSGELEAVCVDDISYVWPAIAKFEEPLRLVRFLAPFDPLVWDRARFEHFWKWPYRFEAYTPAAKRVRGYYALPVLWHDTIVGWANARVAGGVLDVQLGFEGREPKGRDFRRELTAEIARVEAFLGLCPHVD